MTSLLRLRKIGSKEKDILWEVIDVRKRILRCVILISHCLLLTGCWDRTELNQLAITSATAIDWDGKEWTVSYQVVIPQSIANPNTGGSPGQQAPVMVFSTRGGRFEVRCRNLVGKCRVLFFRTQSSRCHR